MHTRKTISNNNRIKENHKFMLFLLFNVSYKQLAKNARKYKKKKNNTEKKYLVLIKG